MVKSVGFNRTVSLHQLDYTANQAKKFTKKEMYSQLDYYLRSDIESANTRKKVISILMKIWYLVDGEQVELRNRIVDGYANFSSEERLLIQWGMTILAFPFFKDIALEMGKLFRLQDEITSGIIKNRIKEKYGDRRHVEVAASAIFTSMKEWGIVDRINKAYVVPKKTHIYSTELLPFIVEVILRSMGANAIPIEMIHNHPLFFPFSFDISVTMLKNSPSLRVDRQGIEMLTVELRVP